MDPAGFRSLFVEEVAGLCGYVARHLGRAHAEDVVQDAFATAAAKMADLPDDRSGQRAWLYTTVKFKIMHVVRDRPKAGIPVSSQTIDGLESSSDEAGGVLDRIAAASVIARLTDPERNLLVMSNIEGIHPSEIAELIGISETAVTTRMTRLRRKLEAYMEEADIALLAVGNDTQPSRGPET